MLLHRGSLKEQSLSFKLAFLTASMLLFSALGYLLSMVIIGFIQGSIVTDLSVLSNRKAMIVLQAVNSLSMFVLSAALCHYFFYSKQDFNHHFKRFRLQSVFLIVGMVLASFPLVQVTGAWNHALTLPEFFSDLEAWIHASENQALRIMKVFFADNSFAALLSNIVVMALLPAVGEEWVFRGLIQRELMRKTNDHTAIWLTAFLFSAIHLQFLGFLPRFLLGALLGYVYVYGKSLAFPILLHFLFNGIQVVAAHTIGIDAIENSISENESQWLLLVVALVATATLVWFVRVFRELNN